jgi:alkylation response protein AidB-like acyl-CoA dehydrogenase
VDDSEAEGAEHDSARAKLVVGRQARALCQLAIQLHGGIGMTEECAVGHYLRRVMVLDQLFGDVDAQAARLAQAL